VVAGIIATMPEVFAAPSGSASQSSRSGNPAEPSYAGQQLPRRGLERLDLMLLAMEAIDLNGGEAMVLMSEQLGFRQIFASRVELWTRRCHNPLRRAARRGSLKPLETDALIRILCAMADRLYPLLRVMLTKAEAPETNQRRWELFEARLAELVGERMNPRRGAVHALLDPQAGLAQRRRLIQSLALAAGNGGFERLRASLLDAAA
jgi:hypothetical protein